MVSLKSNKVYFEEVARDETKYKISRAIKRSKFARFKTGSLADVAMRSLLSGDYSQDFSNMSSNEFSVIARALDHGKFRLNPNCPDKNFYIYPIRHTDGTVETRTEFKNRILGLLGIFPPSQQPPVPSVAFAAPSSTDPEAWASLIQNVAISKDPNVSAALSTFLQAFASPSQGTMAGNKRKRPRDAKELEHGILGPIKEEDEGNEAKGNPGDKEGDDGNDDMEPPSRRPRME